MTRSGAIRIDGLREFQRQLKRLDPELHKALRRRWRGTVKIVSDTARRNAPRLTGELARGIRPKVTQQELGVTTTAPHGAILELGGRHPLFGDRSNWVFQPAQPHLFPAAEAHGDDVARDAALAVEDAARTIGFG